MRTVIHGVLAGFFGAVTVLVVPMVATLWRKTAMQTTSTVEHPVLLAVTARACFSPAEHWVDLM
jgi:hypothetical protein